MQTQNTILGTLCIIFGALLLFAVSNVMLLQLLGAYIAYKIIDYGLALNGLPPISYYIRRWLGGQGF